MRNVDLVSFHHYVPVPWWQVAGAVAILLLVTVVVPVCLWRLWRRRWPRFSLRTLFMFVTLLAVLLTWLFYASGPAIPIEFVVPPGFKGPIEVVQDSNGVNMFEVHEGRLSILIPPSGIIRLSATHLFQQSHEETCREIGRQPRRLENQGSGTDGHGVTTYRWKVE